MGKYENYLISFVLDIDRKYCEWISEKIKNKEVHKKLYSDLIKNTTSIKEEPENPGRMMFGKYQDYKIEEFIF